MEGRTIKNQTRGGGWELEKQKTEKKKGGKKNLKSIQEIAKG